MYPGTTFTWHDVSGIATESQIESVDNQPLYLVLSSFNRGPEELVQVSGKKFYDLFGTKMDFEKHGQPALQAANMINGGARLLVKRVVADDATLANLILVATVKRDIVAISTTADDPDGKTIDQILGRESDQRTYADPLTIVSTVGDDFNTTSLTVTPAISSGNKYVWSVSSDDLMPELDTEIISVEYTAWDGTSDIYVADETKIRLLEVSAADNKIKKCGIITVASKKSNPTTTSVEPATGLPAAYAISSVGEEVGNTLITIADVPAEGNAYYYSSTASMPELGDIITAADVTSNWTAFGENTSNEITVEDKTELVFVELQPVDGTTDYTPVKGFSIVACSKPEPDEREYNSITPITPGTDKFIVATQTNTIKWFGEPAENALDVDDVKGEANKYFNISDPQIALIENGVTIKESSNYPLIVMTDNGRGVSTKSFRIVPDYTVSKEMTDMFYNIQILDGTTVLEKCTATLNPKASYNDKNYGLSEDTAVQVKFISIDKVYDTFINSIEAITGKDAAVVRKYDLINAKDSRGNSLDNLSVDPESTNIGSAYGVDLEMGTNGAFGDAPFGTTAWTDAIVKVFKGEYDEAIWDVDTYKIAAIFDANYPMEVKKAIAEFVSFREDCAYFRDYGVEVTSYASIADYYSSIDEKYKNRYIFDYCTTYQIFDPETKRRIRVSMLYDLARIMVRHFANGCYRPIAGTANDMILSSAIDGTINFTPRITPTVNQKSLLDNYRINYAIFENGNCVVQSTYSSQLNFTQLSFANNVLAIQEVIRAVRTACPKQRYTFVSGTDFTVYADAVNNVLLKFMSNFDTLEFEYEQNDLQALQKIFYAVIKFRFNNWAQTESFDLYALPNESGN